MLIEVLGVEVILGCNPADVNMRRVLAREYPDTIEILVYKLQTFGVIQLVAYGFYI